MKKTGSDKYLENLIVTNRIVYGGESAGAIYAYSDLKKYELLGEPERAIGINNDGLGVIDFAPIPHWGNQKYQAELVKIKNLIEEDNIKTVLIKDNQASFVKDDIFEII